MSKVRLAIVGVGNCASSLVQGLEYYKDAATTDRVPGLMHVELGGYHVNDVEIVADKEESQIILTPQAIEQLQHHRLHRDIERRRRLVQHQQARPAGDGAGDADTGLLAA